MRIILITILYSILYSTAFAQPNSNIEKDTAQANRLLEKVTLLKKNVEEKVNEDISNLHQAALLYEAYPFHEKQIEINSLLAYAYIDIQDSISEAHANKAIELAKVNLNTDMHEYLLYSYLSLLKVNYLSNPEAYIYGEKALLLVKKPSETYFRILAALANSYRYYSNLEKLESLANEMETAINENTIWSKELTVLYFIKMQLFTAKRNFEQVINYGKKCIETNNKNNVYDEYGLGAIYVDIANSYANLGQHETAVQWVKEGIEKANPPEGSEELASYYANLNYIYALMPNQKLKAIEYAKKAVTIFLKNKTENSYPLQVLNVNIANCYYELRDLENALLYVEKSLSHGDNIYAQDLYGSILKSLERYDEALVSIQKSIQGIAPNFQPTDVYDNPSKYEVYTDNYWASLILINKALILTAKGIEEKNINILDKGIETANLSKFVMQRLLEAMKGFGQSKLTNSNLIARVSNVLMHAYFQKYQLQADEANLDNLFNSIEVLKAMLLLETLTPSALPDSLFVVEEELVNNKRQQEQLLEMSSKDSLDFYQTAFFDASIALEEFYTTMNKQYPKEMASFYNLQYVSVDNLQAELSPETLMIEYSFFENYNKGYSLFIYTVSKTTKNVTKIELNADFTENIKELNLLLKNPFLVQQANREKFINLSNDLYKILISPIEAELADKSKLIIVPQAELFYLPFEVLLSTNENKAFHELDFLIKDIDISYQYSATIYHQLKQKTAIKDKSLLAFAPVFENGQAINDADRSMDFMVDSLYESIDNNKFIGLPNTKKEVKTIAEIVTKNNGKATILLEKGATKKQLQSMLKQPNQFIHIATHGLVNYQNPKLSALACYEDGTKVGNDLLFANEIQMQDIKTDLVVLSSCESGIGQLVTSEGLIALNRSFIYTGANNVMFSLWKVNDEYTSKLMIDFYKYYFQSESYTTALRQAKLKMLQDPITANPRYWAAFLLIGE